MCTQLFFQVIMYCTSMIEVLLGVGLSAHKWSAPQRWSAPQQCSATQMVSPAASDGQPYAHAHVLKVQSSFDRLRSEVKGEGQPFCT